MKSVVEKFKDIDQILLVHFLGYYEESNTNGRFHKQ